MYVFELELLHRFRYVLKHLPAYAKRYNPKSIVVTTPDHLINYQDEQENKDIYIHAWQLMKQMGKNYTLVVGILPNTDQYNLAKKFCQEIWEYPYGTHSNFSTYGH